MKPLYLLVLSPILICSCSSEKQKDEPIEVHGTLREEFIPKVITPKITLKQAEQKLQAAWTPSCKSHAISKVKFFEGFSNVAYICPAGEKTIGYGFTGKLTDLKWISRCEADKILENELMKCQTLVKKIVKVKLNNAQLWTLTSFTYNCGEGSLRTLVNGKGRLNSGNFKSVPKLLPLYCKGNGKILKGLVNRRDWESHLWNGKI